jgi:redox-sensitive bicupin YhaK (pirin superfamily)
MSPGDLGLHLKPFVFLDIFEGDMSRLRDSMPLHPHSGIATVTVFTEGDVRYEDPLVGKGNLAYGAVEFMLAGGGVWHGKELSSGESGRVRGIQLWIALPPELESGPAEPQYVEESLIPRIGSARLVLGRYQGHQSPVRAPEGINYLMVQLSPGEKFIYEPPLQHEVAWLVMSRGQLFETTVAHEGELAMFERGEGDIVLKAGPEGASLVLGSARLHAHDLHLGNYSVHTSEKSLALGEARIKELREKLVVDGRFSQSGAVPVQR